MDYLEYQTFDKYLTPSYIEYYLKRMYCFVRKQNTLCLRTQPLSFVNNVYKPEVESIKMWRMFFIRHLKVL